MKKLIFIVSILVSFTISAQEIVWDNGAVWDQGIPFSPNDKYIDSLTEQLDLFKIKDSRDYDLSAEEKSTCIEIGLAFFAKREYEAANWYFNKTLDFKKRPVESKISAEKEYVYLIKEVPVFTQENENEKTEIKEMSKDLKFLENLPKSFDNLSKEDLSKLKEKLQSQIDKLIFEKDSLIKLNAPKEQIDSKQDMISTLEKESEIIDLTIENGDLNGSNKSLENQKKELKKYLWWSLIGLTLLTLLIIAILQRKTIKVKDDKIHEQWDDIIKKNTFLEHAAKLIRHDMHSGINTYIPRGLNSLERKLTSEDIKNLKIEPYLRMIKEGLQHTQKVYKSVYEFTNLVKQDVVLDKTKLNVKEIITNYLNNTSYKNQVLIDELGYLNVNEQLFCVAIDNLIKNGLKYNSSENKVIKIYLEKNYIIIEDNGNGLSKNEFENYSKPQNFKTGFGISISVTILEEHGFEIFCEKLNVGTKIKIKTN